MIFHGCHYIGSKSRVKREGSVNFPNIYKFNKNRSTGRIVSTWGAILILSDPEWVLFCLIQG